MARVVSENETLDFTDRTIFLWKIDLKKKQTILLELEEFRAELFDNILNFMNMAEPKEINYLNFSDGSSFW